MPKVHCDRNWCKHREDCWPACTLDYIEFEAGKCLQFESKEPVRFRPELEEFVSRVIHNQK